MVLHQLLDADVLLWFAWALFFLAVLDLDFFPEPMSNNSVRARLITTIATRTTAHTVYELEDAV
jgi:hypothetical protein